ncbi:MAG: peptide-methionine (S)-S-oxide reductase MsrA [Alcaligenaceae bacterium]|nr:peptide-methionine (S)-S-oxide reductase MsrA [Alcaligenaceae bacterium]
MRFPSQLSAGNQAKPPRRRTALGALGAACILAVSAAGLALVSPVHAFEQAVTIAAPTQDIPAGGRHTETAVLAGGCFWGIQGVYQHVQGVQRVVSGYAGGTADTAHYRTVGSGRTGHAESVEITFDPSQVSYGALLQIFFSVAHNPTELNRQGPDTGTQYRSAIFPMNESQQHVAQAYIAQLDAAHAFKQAIVTRVEPYTGFYPAEAYHQDFMTRNPNSPYIVINDLPKVENLEKLFPKRWRPDPVLVGAG